MRHTHNTNTPSSASSSKRLFEQNSANRKKPTLFQHEKFTLALFALFGLTLAQKAIILSQIEMIYHALDSLGIDVFSLAAEADTAVATTLLTTKSTSVLNAINNAITAIGAAIPLDLIGASALVEPSEHLVAETEMAVNNLIAKKDIIEGAGQMAAVLEILKKQGAAAAKLADAIVAKVPTDAQAIATGPRDKIAAISQKVFVAFS